MDSTREESGATGIEETLRRRFEAAWLHGKPEPIEACLPAAGDPCYLPTLEELVQIELEFAWKSYRRAAEEAGATGEVQTGIDTPRLETYLERFPSLGEPARFRRLVEQECLVRRQLGQAPSVEEYCRRFPQLASQRAWLERALQGEEAADAGDVETLIAPVRCRPGEAGPRGGRFGNYELLEEIGRGAMGVVYRARQCSAGRVVALKVIRRDRLELMARESQTNAVDRFRHEAQAAARLEHEHIVTVYEVGEVQGELFYSMRYVEGESLAGLLRGGPLDSRRAGAYMESVAEALHEVHLRGVLHRDLKPQNILVDRRTDRALVADFGLAKLVEQGQELTQSGDVMGTPPYMPPEQVRDSSRVTTLSDVYAAGATLYHLLTGRPPYQAATGIETLRQVLDQEPVRPRQLNPAIDADMETICLKCLQKEPSRRYGSAKELAEDLARHRRGEPIQARPVGRGERAWRWCRRNPLPAGLAALAASLLLATLAAMTVGYIRTSRALEDAQAAKLQSDENFRQAREVVDAFFTRVADDRLLDQPGMQPLRKELLEQALTYYQRFLAQRGDDPTLRDELAATYFRVGQITEAIQSAAAGLKAYAAARDIQAELLTETPEDLSRLQALGNTLNAMGRAFQRTHELDQAGQWFSEAAVVRERLVKAAPQHVEFQRCLANTYMNQGVVEKGRGRTDEARRYFLRAQALREHLLRGHLRDERSADIRRDLGMGFFNLADLAMGQNRAEEGRRNLEQAIGVFEEIRRQAPGDLANQHRLGLSYRTLADVLASLKEFEDAAVDYGKARQVLDTLAQANPRVREYQIALAHVHVNLGDLQQQAGAKAEALASFQRAAKLLEPIAQASPDDAMCRRDLGAVLRAMAETEFAFSSGAAAQTHVEQAIRHLEDLTRRHPDNRDFAAELKKAELLRQTITTGK